MLPAAWTWNHETSNFVLKSLWIGQRHATKRCSGHFRVFLESFKFLPILSFSQPRGHRLKCSRRHEQEIMKRQILYSNHSELVTGMPQRGVLDILECLWRVLNFCPFCRFHSRAVIVWHAPGGMNMKSWNVKFCTQITLNWSQACHKEVFWTF